MTRYVAGSNPAPTHGLKHHALLTQKPEEVSQSNDGCLFDQPEKRVRLQEPAAPSGKCHAARGYRFSAYPGGASERAGAPNGHRGIA